MITPISHGLGAGLDDGRALHHALLELLQRHTARPDAEASLTKAAAYPDIIGPVAGPPLLEAPAGAEIGSQPAE